MAVTVLVDPDPFATVGEPARLWVVAGAQITPETATTVPRSAPTLIPPFVADAVPAAVETVVPTTSAPPSTTAPAPLPVPVTTALPTVRAAPAPDVAMQASTSTRSTVAVARGSVIPVFPTPDDRPGASTLYASTTELRGPRVFLTLAVESDWVRVALAVRPNGSEGWVRRADVDLVTITDRIEVSLAGRTLRWFRDDRLVFEVPAAIGAPASPTPPGSYYVTDRVAQPGNGYGPWLLALNGYSETFDTFDGGDARLAIHGTAAPRTIGTAASNGCIRLADGPLGMLATALPLGTPVVVS